MNVERLIKVIAGSLVLLSALAGFFLSKYWLFVTMFVGANLLQFGFTKFCPLGIILKKCGVKE